MNKKSVYDKVGNFLLIQSILFAGFTRLVKDTSTQYAGLKWALPLAGFAGIIFLLFPTKDSSDRRKDIDEWIAILFFSLTFGAIWFFSMPINHTLALNFLGEGFAKNIAYIIPAVVFSAGLFLLKVSKGTGLALVILGALGFFIAFL